MIFLDIDGVLNSKSYLACAAKSNAGSYKHLNPKKILLLKWIVEQSDADIVLSSSWKELFFHMTPIEPAAKTLLEVLHNHGMNIRDMTPIMGGDRPQEIKHWLSMHPEVTSYVILDDHRYKWGELSPHWVQTSQRSGLTQRTAQTAVSILRN
ncbi:hypothetical protein LJC04_04500 [Ruminococcaceae bacterium OttesenSCG-928-O06]|nr:hypothetical protein [Ruminococcaceae bacterium OttesenSCG-928-O06]